MEFQQKNRTSLYLQAMSSNLNSIFLPSLAIMTLHRENGIIYSHTLPLIRRESKIKPTGCLANAEPPSPVNGHRNTHANVQLRTTQSGRENQPDPH